MEIRSENALREWIRKCVEDAPIFDVHTHLYAPCFGDLLRTGLDETVTYHYLIEETVLQTGMKPEKFWAMPKRQQADTVWKTLFVDRMPVSESCRTILAMFQKDGLDLNQKDLDYYRAYYDSLDRNAYIDTVFTREHITGTFMTNDPFDDREAPIWLNGTYQEDPRFLPALRIDELLFFTEDAAAKLQEWGYQVERKDGRPTPASLGEISRFLEDWLKRTGAVYCAASLPVTFSLSEPDVVSEILTECVLPVCAERKVPVSLMLGVTRRVHPAMGEAGDSLGKVDIRELHRLFREHRNNLFLITTLVRENQHELTSTARIFSNVMIFGCWWFLNNPVFMEEMTRMRYEMLGPKFVAQHSDANMIGHLVGKWSRFKVVFERVLQRYYGELLSMGYYPDDERIREEVADLLGGYFHKFLARNYEA